MTSVHFVRSFHDFHILPNQACFAVLQSWISRKFMTGWYIFHREHIAEVFLLLNFLHLTLLLQLLLQCGSFSSGYYIFHYLVVYPVCGWFLQSIICQSWSSYIWYSFVAICKLFL